MKRTPWTATVVILLGTLWLLSGIAWADPTGPANVIQINSVVTFNGATGYFQRTFSTTDPFGVEAVYYDPNPACAGVALPLVQVLFFNLEGQLLFTSIGAGNIPLAGASSRYRLLFFNLLPGALPAGNYQVVFLAKDCPNVNILISGLYLIRVLAP